MNASPSRIVVDRDLTVEERSIIEWLLAHGDGDNAEFIEQLKQARVVAHCACGCASVDLAIAGQSSTAPMRVLADFQWTTADGHLCGAFVFEQDGLLVGSTFGRLTEKPCLGRCLPRKTWSRSARCGPSFAACNTSERTSGE